MSAIFVRRLSGWLATRNAHLMLCGGLSGIYLLTFCQRFWSAFGTSLPMVTGVALAIGIGCQAAILRGSRLRAGFAGDAAAWGMAHLALAAWVLAYGGLTAGAMRVAELISTEALASRAIGVSFSCAVAAVLLALPTYLIARLPFLRPSGTEAEASPSTNLRNYVLGLAGGLLLATTIGASSIGVRNSGLIAAVISSALFLTSLVKRRVPKTVEATTAIATKRLATSDRAATAWIVVSTAAFGGLAAIAGRMLHQLTPLAGYLVYSEWAALMLGIAIGCRRTKSTECTTRQRIGSCSAACLLLAAAAVVLLACDRLLIDLMLAINSRVSIVWLSMAMRCGLGALFFLPIGLAWGRVGRSDQPSAISDQLSEAGEPNSPPSQGEAGGGWKRRALQWLTIRLKSASHTTSDALSAIVPPTLTLPARLSSPQARKGGGELAVSAQGGIVGVGGNPWPLAFAVGYLLTRTVGFPNFDLPLLLIGTSWLLAVMAIIGWLATRTFPRHVVARTAVIVAGCLLASAGLVRDFGAGDRAAKLLFATNVFLAKQQGLETKFLPVLDDGRLLASRAGDRGTYTVWKYRGAQLQIRESGIPKAVITTRSGICPEYSPEKMHTVLPLVLHDKPRNVLLLGLGGGDGLATCIAFPVPSITCVEDDGGLLDVLRNVVWPSCDIDPLADNRVRLLKLDPALAVADRQGSYDVIISRPDQPALWQAAPYFTWEFYRRAAGLLADDGIFCQRFQQVDFGPGPLRTLAHTMQKAFSHVAAIETGPGELVLLATNSPQGVVHAGLKDRLQRPHVREALAQLGWDWTVPLNLTTLSHESLARFADEGPASTNTADNALFTFRLPQEVMRWGDKLREQRDSTIQHATPLLAWPGLDDSDPEILWRLAELAGRQRLMTAFPDQKFAYRKTLREQMAKSKESLGLQLSQQLKGETVHPQDKQRMQYLEALGEAAKSPEPSLESIDRVAKFVEPFDPLLSYFAHHEVAELLTRAAVRDPNSELQHRLYLAYFTDNRDQSVRNLASALDLLVEHPEAVADPQDRFDQLNGLLQMLKSRWEQRGVATPKSVQFALNDVDKSVTAVERSFAAMDELSTELGQPVSDWTTRREFLETVLVRPLRSYRHRLLPIHLKQQQRTEELIGKDRADENRTLGN
ncbi:MAG: hypothetical protein WD648_12795 [Planctomycetaceae bacterium]